MKSWGSFFRQTLESEKETHFLSFLIFHDFPPKIIYYTGIPFAATKCCGKYCRFRLKTPCCERGSRATSDASTSLHIWSTTQSSRCPSSQIQSACGNQLSHGKYCSIIRAGRQTGVASGLALAPFPSVKKLSQLEYLSSE